MNVPEFLMLHCTATPQGKDYSAKQIANWWTSRGWKNPGYRHVIHLDGTISVLQKWDSDNIMQPSEVTNGARSWNSKTIHISYVGGVASNDITKPVDTRTHDQMQQLEVQIRFFIALHPNIKVIGHNQVAKKACPSFNVPNYCRDVLCLKEHNIYESSLEIISPANLEFEIEFLEKDPFDFELFKRNL